MKQVLTISCKQVKRRDSIPRRLKSIIYPSFQKPKLALVASALLMLPIPNQLPVDPTRKRVHPTKSLYPHPSSRLQDPREPESPAEQSLIVSRQVPAADMPLNAESEPTEV